MQVVVSRIVGLGGTLHLKAVSIWVIDSVVPTNDRAVEGPSLI